MQTGLLSRLKTLSPYAGALLQGPATPLEPVIRAELFGRQRFEEHGRSLARAQPVATHEERSHASVFFPRVDDNIAMLRRAYDYVAQTFSSGHYVTPAAEWLLDNFHLVESQFQQIHEGVPRRYYADLPKLATPPLAGLPRVYGIAWAYVAHTDSVLTPELFMAFLEAYQEVDELTLGELWALPTTLRVVLLENLRRVAEQIAAGKVAREVAHAVWDAAAQLDDTALDALLVRLRELGLQRAYLAQLWQRLPAAPDEAPLLSAWIARHCPEGLGLVEEGQSSQVAANLTVSNIITTFRLIGQVDWTELIDPVSRPLQVLRQLASFTQESDSTRQQITHAVERLARQTQRTEREIAAAVVALAGQGDDAAARTAGFYLLGAGRTALQAHLSPRAAAQPEAPPRQPQHTQLATYALAWSMGTLAVLVAMALAHDGPWGPAALLALVLAAFPVSEAVAALIQRLGAEATRVRVLPRLRCTAGLPPDARTLVVMPVLITSQSGIEALVRQLEQHWLANREDEAQFALLTDWADADTEHADSDEALLAHALQAIDALNLRHPRAPQEAPRFLLLHRARRYSATQRRWLGWERKRGKLEELVRAIAQGHHQGFIAHGGPMRIADGTRFVLTLDADTGLPPGTLRELVAIAAHPLNAPVIDRATRTVVAGFGILQPRLVAPLPAPEESTPLSRWFGGQSGLDPYSHSSFDLYQDVFGLGTFTGKGLLNVHAVHAVLDRALPGELVLSHDLLEGSIARCAYVSDVVLLEDPPTHAAVAASRLHRWTRGDWQLLPLMLRAAHYRIDRLGLWKMADNLRRSLVAPASFALWLLVVFTGALPLWLALAVTLSAYLAGPLVAALAGMVPTRRGIAWRHFFDQGLADVQRALAGSAWQFSQLARTALLQLDAIARALWRMGVSRRLLLEWTTAAEAQAAARPELSAFVRQQARASGLCVAVAVAALAGPHPLAGAVLFAAWAAAPVAAWWASRARAVPPPAASTQAYLREIARDTWRFFAQNVGALDNHLPIDNLQMEPEPTPATRTSPTNIGLYLLAVLSAREFGWIGKAEVISRISATLATTERLVKHRGHLYNWYDTRSLQVLQPAYVSTVDSGNLAAFLLAAAQGCRALAALAVDTRDPPHAAAALHALAQRSEALALAMDFRGLYDARRHLFHIGLRTHEQALDTSYYDLLASESRLCSFVAIAKGDVPLRHWMALGRAFLAVDRQPGLKSWSGSMFEYLMPSLLMPEPAQGLLQEANGAALAEQMAWGFAHRVPWGVSESAYFGQDHTLAYQYSPFGVPRLALRRTPPADRVVAPYATLMAAMFVPEEAATNLRWLEQLGSRSKYGYMEAVDFTAARQPHAQKFSLVHTFMAHHQGMALTALCNLLCAEAPRRWFASHPLLRAHLSLLHEKTPRQIVQSADPRSPPLWLAARGTQAFHAREIAPARAQWPALQLLSNGHYSVALHANGAGLSRWRGRNISRWRDDLLRDAHGTFLYVRREDAQRLTSLTAHPAPSPEWRYKARFLADRVQFDAISPELESTLTVLVSPEDDTEIRSLTLLNRSDAPVVYEVISCLQPVLADPRADEAHPAFANLFIKTRWEPAWRALLLERTPRLAQDPPLAAAHFLTHCEADIVSVHCLADRRAFAGRNQPVGEPLLLAQLADAGGALINGLDPVAGLCVKIRIAAGAVAQLGFATTAAEQAAALPACIDKYLQKMHVERATRMASTMAQVRLRDLGIDPAEAAAVQDLSTALLYTVPRPHAGSGALDQRQLWRHGISGDNALILVRIHSSIGLPLVHALLRAQPLWTLGGIATDIVVLNSEPASYLMPLQREMQALRDRLAHHARVDLGTRNAGFFLLREQEVSEGERAALTGLARAQFAADGRPLDVQVNALREQWQGRLHMPAEHTLLQPPSEAAQDYRAPSGTFEAASGEFALEVDAGLRTPRPWINVIANPGFGFQISESGAGYTWAVNSRLHQLTPWSNDPVADPSGELYLLQDLDDGRLVGLTPQPGRALGQRHRVRHAQGYTVFETLQGGLQCETTFFADVHDSVKIVQVRLRNTGTQARTLRAVGLVEWQMGAARQDRRTLETARLEGVHAVSAEQREQRAGFGGCTAFLLLAGLPTEAAGWTCDRSEFFDTLGRMGLPRALARRAGADYDPCAALSADFSIGAGEEGEFAFVLGHALNPAAARALAARWQGADLHHAFAQVRAQWDGLLGRAQVRTPDALFDALVNRWLPYQTLACRLWSRAAFYQAGGAFGFRDQLQDALAFALTDPARLRAQIVLNASRQFAEGDVQHWWHAPAGEGVRTHFSDDLLWLPYACAHYLDVTGDTAVLDEEVHFIDGPAVPEGQEDAYYTPAPSPHRASIYEHAARTIDRSLATGRHGLPLMGTGDWNDGMNRVGHEGQGESVWLGWFLCSVVEGFAPWAEQRGETVRASRWRAAREGWIAALHGPGWDGAWFRRAFFDDGHPLGAAENEECRIDLIAQAWAVLSGAGLPGPTQQAMHSLREHLWDEEHALLRLLHPPLQHASHNPGYIQAYPPGVRENGGQYCHGAVWALMAQARLGQAHEAWQSFEALSPAHRAAHAERGPRYELEPYVMAGDIYGAAPYAGRGGWSWYTGSAAWLWRAALESLLGLQVRRGRLRLSPLPHPAWTRFSLHLNLPERSLQLHWLHRDTPRDAAPQTQWQVREGEWLDLAALAPRSAVLVWGAPVAAPDPTSREAARQALS